MMSAMDTPPERNLTIDVDSLAGALSRLNVEARLPGSTPKRSRCKKKREVRSKRTLFETHPGPPSPVSESGVGPVSQQFPPWSVQEEQALVNLSCSTLMAQDGAIEPAKVTSFGRMLDPISRVRSIHSIVEQVCFVETCILAMVLSYYYFYYHRAGL